MLAYGSKNMGKCVSRMVSMRWSERSFERIACDLRSRSLEYSGNEPSQNRLGLEWGEGINLSVPRGFIESLHSARKTRNASLIKRSFVVMCFDNGVAGSLS